MRRMKPCSVGTTSSTSRPRTRWGISPPGLAPAAVFGTSSGATFALCLTITRPELVRGAVLHEPVMARLYDDPSAGRAPIAAGGLERFWRLVAGDANWDRLEPARADAGRAATFFTVEAGTSEN